jgi:chorismate synthase
MLRFMTAGESHGPALVVIVDGLPAGLPVDRAELDRQLRRRQLGHGRGQRMKIETDAAEIVSGVRQGRTIGSPVTLLIRNRDHERWLNVMSSAPASAEATPRREVHHPRPGHADLAGAFKYLARDMRDVLERASARETAARVAAGALVGPLLRAAGIDVRSHVLRIGRQGIPAGSVVPWDQLANVDESPVRCSDSAMSDAMVEAIDQARTAGDSLGGSFEVVAAGVPPGLGTCGQWDRRLDGRLAQAVMSIQAVKAVAIGSGLDAAATMGSAFHDEIFHDAARGLHRGSNRAGGIEGGVTNGEEVRVTAIVKPIPTLMKPLRSVDLRTLEPHTASVERSDVCVVPAAGVVGEAMVGWVLADALIEKTGGDSLGEVLRHLEATRAQWLELLRPTAGASPPAAGSTDLR